ncbi:MAG: DUF2057 family protein [Shewanella sp.]
MKKTLLNKSLLSIAFMLGAQLSNATAASLQSTDNLSIISVNGESTTPFNPIQLPAGKVLLELKYQDIFNSRADDSGHWVKSHPLYLILNITESEGDSYKIIPPKIITESEARQFIKYPTIQLSINGDKANEYPLQSQSQLMAKMITSHPAF